jgi:hypothetical protein
MVTSCQLPVRRSELSQATVGLQAVLRALAKLGNGTDRVLGNCQEEIHISLISGKNTG